MASVIQRVSHALFPTGWNMWNTVLGKESFSVTLVAKGVTLPAQPVTLCPDV
jgi:hypothetical protein